MDDSDLPQRLLRCIGVLDVTLPRLARFALRSSISIFPPDIVRSERLHVSSYIPLSSLLGCLRPASVRLWQDISKVGTSETLQRDRAYLFLRWTQTSILLASFLSSLSDVELAIGSRLMTLDPVREVELPSGGG